MVSLLVVLTLIRAAQRDGPAALAAWRDAEPRWEWIALSILCGLMGHAALMVGWRRLLADSGTPVSLGQTARLLLVS